MGLRAVGVRRGEGLPRGEGVAGLALALALGAPVAVAWLALGVALEAPPPPPPSSEGEAAPLALWLVVEVGLRLPLGVPAAPEALGCEALAQALALGESVSDTHSEGLGEAVAQVEVMGEALRLRVAVTQALGVAAALPGVRVGEAPPL